MLENNNSQEMQNTDFGFTRVKSNEKRHLVANIFNSVATKYDLMNDVMSLGMHRIWKNFTILASHIKRGDKVLDVAAGTADMTIKFKNLVGEEGEVWHTDINHEMLKIGKIKMLNKGIVTPRTLCDAENLPFNNQYFNHVCVAFGLRNMTNKQRALDEMYRVIKIGGSLIILEFSKINPLLKPLYDLYSFKFLPLMGQIIANDKKSYQYLAESIRMHPDQETLKQMMLNAGFEVVKYNNLSLGIVAIHIGFKI